MICTCPGCKTQFFENKVKIGKWDEYEKYYDEKYYGCEGFVFIYKGRNISFNCSACKKEVLLYSEEKFIKKIKDINYKPIKKPWWRFK